VHDYRATLRRLALRDDRFIEQLLADERRSSFEPELDARSRALVQVGALIALDAGPPSYMSAADKALLAGASYEEIVDTLLAVLPVVGAARVVSAAPNLALALGYDTAAALEAVESRDPTG
jgi:alkylhydroperoxidase/carboxymuconolactone decarboxylase family protein YurZ